jgi:hypothetical protein
MDKTTVQLDKIIQDILDACRSRAWYGPELERMQSLQDPRRLGFTSPAATPQQLEETGRALGFPLLKGLQTLYMRIANGSFGPGYGLRGAVGGFPNADETLARMYPYSGECLVDLEQEPAWERWKGDPHYVLDFSSARWWNMG